MFEIVNEQANVHVGHPNPEFRGDSILDIREFQSIGDPLRYFLFLSVVQSHKSPAARRDCSPRNVEAERIYSRAH